MAKSAGGGPLPKKRIPLRMCSGCMEHKPKKDLVRVVRTPEGELLLDPTGKRNGRGAYLCPNPECLKKARKARRFERALECPIPEEVYERLLAQLESGEDGDAR